MIRFDWITPLVIRLLRVRTFQKIVLEILNKKSDVTAAFPTVNYLVTHYLSIDTEMTLGLIQYKLIYEGGVYPELINTFILKQFSIPERLCHGANKVEYA